MGHATKSGDPGWRWLIFTWSVLVAYRALKLFVGQTTALKILQAVLSRPFKWRVKAYMLDRFGISQDVPGEAFDRIVENFIARGEKLYGSGWTYVQSVRDQRRCYVDVTNCLFNNVCKAHAAPELASLFCALDGVWIEELHKAQYEAHFERPTTLAAGDDRCRFQFSRAEAEVPFPAQPHIRRSTGSQSIAEPPIGELGRPRHHGATAKE